MIVALVTAHLSDGITEVRTKMLIKFEGMVN